MKKNSLPIFFFFSGAAALVYEQVWSRMLQAVFSSTIYTAAAVFAIFLAGFSLGSFVCGRTADRLQNPVRMLTLISFLLGAYGLLMLPVFSKLAVWYALLPDWFAVRLLLCLLIILPTATLFGACWPLVGKAGIVDTANTGQTIGRLYSANSIGAALGAFSGGFILAPLFGFLQAALAASLMNIISGFILLVVEKNSSEEHADR